MTGWPESIDELTAEQGELGRLAPEAWIPSGKPVAIGGVFVCFGRGGRGPGAAGDAGWAATAVCRSGAIIASAVVSGEAGGAYVPGCLALREGPLLEGAVTALAGPPDVLLVNATGRDHPRRAGLAFHLGARLGIPTVGVTHRPLLASGDRPLSTARGAHTPLLVENDVVGWWVRTRSGCLPLAVHAGWRTSPETARAVLLDAVTTTRTPQPMREARRLARTARGESGYGQIPR